MNVARCAVCLAVVLPAAAAADTVILKDGRRFSDVLVTQERAHVVLVFRSGRIQRIRRDQVARVQIAPRTWNKPEQRRPAVSERQRPPPKRMGHIRAMTLEAAGVATEPWVPTPVARSAILPGWGQYTVGRRSTGLAAIAASGLLILAYHDYRLRFHEAEARYNDPALGLVNLALGAPGFVVTYGYAARLKQRVERYGRRGNLALLIFSGVWLWSVADIGGFRFELTGSAEQAAFQARFAF